MRTSTKKLRLLLTGLTLATLLLSVFGAFPVWAQTPTPVVTLGFYNITHNNGGDAAVARAQLFVNVESVGEQVLFTFYNTGPAASSITDVYFDHNPLAPLLSGIAAIYNTDPGVSFSEGASPFNLPAGNTVGFTADFSADSDPPTQPNGVNPYESLGILFDLAGDKTFADVLAELESGVLWIGIHVQGFSSGGSEALVTTPPDDPPEYGTIIIIKDADPADGTDFEFASDQLGSFFLDDAFVDDQDNYVSSQTFTDLVPGEYSVAEVIPGGDWELASIECSSPSDNTTVDLDEATVTITLEGTERVVCLFTNAKLTAIKLASFTAKSSIRSTHLAWETGTEVDNVGFNLYRATTPDGPYTQVNAALIVAKGDPVAGASYGLVDKGLTAGTYYYQLEDIDLNGTATRHGPVTVKVLPSLRRPSYRPATP